MPQQFYIAGSKEAISLPDKPFASGGEGGLYAIEHPVRYLDYVAKIYHPHKRKSESREEKLSYMLNNRPNVEQEGQHQPIIWVDQLLYDAQDNFVGYLMPKAKGEKLEVLCAPNLPKRLGRAWHRLAFGHEDAWRLRMKVCYNIAAAVSQLHASGRYVLVDLKPDNVLIQSNGLIALVDMDSIEVVENGQTVFPATVVTPEYTPPEYYDGLRPGEKCIPKSWDEFSLAVIFYRLLLGIHPFAASALPPYDQMVSLGDKIHQGLYVHHRQELFSVIPPPHRQFEELEEEIQALFNRSFVAGHQQPEERISAEEWGNTFMNSPLLLIDRPLPSKVLSVEHKQQQNWYELAVSRAVAELKLAAPELKELQEQLVDGGMNQKLFREKTLKLYKTAGRIALNLLKFVGIVFVVIVAFVFLIGAVSDDFDFATAFEVLGELFFFIPRTIFNLITSPSSWLFVLIPLIISSGQSIMKFVGKKVSQLLEFAQEQMALTKSQRRRYLEDKQYSLFTERVKLKQKVQDIRQELDTLLKLKEKRERNFQNTYGKNVRSANQRIQADIAKESYQIKVQDQKARELMRAEAKEIRALRQQYQNYLQAAPYSQILGHSPEQKLQQLPYWAGAEGIDKSEELQIARQLENWKNSFEKELQLIQNRYDQAQKELVQEGETHKIKIEDIVKKASKEIRQESQLDDKLLDKAYRKLLKTRNELLIELHGEEHKLKDLNQKIKLLRSELTQLR
ncbi:protein kinase domain-containing protein [Saprospira grandis]|uniref:protein kinase domain-containing protein n=1 Tax=Saprospira grandis TaxID=1008 RepID=UPI0022DD359B|nr:serine/threonine protein kinase [Saprospira grandis]WBM74974.1 serine/threonine protein kinase [Saprospira grandis]